MSSCPDILTIQALLDQEITDPQVLSHVKSCPLCQAAKAELRKLLDLSKALATEEELAPYFYQRLTRKIESRRLMLVFATLPLFLGALYLLLLFNLDYLRWWLAAGMTALISRIMDIFIIFFYYAQAAHPFKIIMGFALVVAAEIYILSKLRAVEG